MRHSFRSTLLSASILLLSPSLAQAATLSTQIDGIHEGKPIPAEYAFCTADGKGKAKDGGNKSPAISWKKGPEGTQSYAIIMHDEDVPTKFDDANQPGKTISASLPRRDYYHWVLVDIPADTLSLRQGAESEGVVKTGKPLGKQAYGVRGKNSFGENTKGSFGGYDGPCPPWNDEIVHHYHFNIYALDVPSLNLSGEFGGKEAMDAIKGHILASDEIIATYATNAKLIK